MWNEEAWFSRLFDEISFVRVGRVQCTHEIFLKSYLAVLRTIL